MLVTFHTKEATSVTMFGGFAMQLLKFMGHSPAVPGALLASDVPEALARLRENVCETGDLPDREPNWKVRCQPFAYPLIELLTIAANTHCDVLWEEGMSPI